MSRSKDQLFRTVQAEEDLTEIWGYIAHNDISAADRLIDLLDRKSWLLASNPRLGFVRRGLASDMRYFPVGRYLILYRIITGGIEVVRYVHGMRRLRGLINDDSNAPV